MIIRYLLTVLILVGVSAGCKKPAAAGDQEGTSPNIEGLTESGHRYQFYMNLPGPEAQPGDIVTFHETVYKNDSMWYSTYMDDRPIKARLPERDEIIGPPPPRYEAVLLMSEGDSLVVTHDLDSVPDLPPNLKPSDIVRYHIRLEEIRTKDETKDQDQRE